MSKESEERAKVRLDQIAASYDPSTPEGTFDYWFVRLSFETAQKFLRGSSILELGCSTGHMTSLLADVARELTVVEGSKLNLERARKQVGEKAKHIMFVHSLWEKYEPHRQFDEVVMMGALEHVDDPVLVLRLVKTWLNPNGRIHVVVPNARSLHRRIGLYMKLLSSIDHFSESDRLLDHKRLYTRELLISHIEEGGFEVLHWQGILLKPLSNAQMQPWPESLVRAFYQAGLELPDYCGELYVCAVPGRSDIAQAAIVR